MLLANKHLIPVIGIDIHIVIIPPGIPTPLPHPFIGMIMDPADYIPFIGSTVNVNNMPRGNSGTAGMLGTMVHIPMGGPFAMAPMIGHDSMNFFGSTRVNADGSYMSPSGYMVMSCNDIGMPLSLTPGKKMKPVPSLYLPTSSTIPIPSGPPVMVGGPYAPDLLGMVMALVMSYGMGSLMKGLGKAASKGLKKLNHGVLKKFKCTKGLSDSLCKKGFEPVDLITGRMLYDGQDFEIPGIIPITWKRSWYSDSEYEGLLGYGYHNNYDIALHIEEKDDAIIMMLPDGRATVFPLLIAKEETFYHRSEKLTLTFIDRNTYTVKDHNTDLTYTFRKRTETLYRPKSLSNANGAAITFNYNAVNQLEQIIDTAGRLINLQLDSKGRTTEITATHNGNKRKLVSYTYNEDGDLIAITDALEQTTSMEYQNHLMVKKTDRNGQAFYWEYNGKTTGAKCIKTWGDGGILSGTIQYEKNHNIVTNSLGEETIYYFDSNNLCTQVTNPIGSHTFHEFTDFMEPYRDIDEEGNVTGYSYDSRGNLTGLHQPDGSIVTFIYDEEDRLILTKSPEGSDYTKVYKEDKLHATIATSGAVTSFIYNNNGLIHSIRNDAGNETILNYDEDYNLKEMLFSNGAKSTWNYDSWGRCTQVINAEHHKQQFFYDALDRVQKIQQADNNTIKLEYNAYDEVLSTIDSKKRAVNFEYTPMGSLKAREEKGRTVHFKYNTEEQLQAITNEHNEYYRFGRDASGSIINETGFDGLRRDYLRDRAGKVLKVKRPNNRFTEYEYDNNGRIIRAEHHDGTWETYTYDLNGNLIEAINQNTQVQLVRDDAGRIIKEIQDGHEVISEYNNLNRTKISSSLGADISLSRNALGLLEKVSATVTTENEDTRNTWNAKLAYNSLGQEVERILPGNVTSTMAYDFAGRPIAQKVTHANKETRHRTYAWDANDQLQKMVNQLTNGVVSFGYDDFGSLASARYEDQQFDYKLPDEVGNLYRTKGKGDRKYAKGGQLLKANGNSFKYDSEGNLVTKITNKGDYNYTWYGNGMLKNVKRPDHKEIAFEYDALGRRTAKIFNNTIERFVWDGNVPLHEWKYNVKDRPKLIVDEFGLLTENEPEPIENLITWVFDEGTFKPAAKITEQDTYSIITDYLGTPVEMYNSNGEKTWEVEYDIYGKVRKQIKGTAGDCPFRYQGQYEDEETGLYYNRFRYYSADEGVYLSQDPIGLDGGISNHYSYSSDSNKLIDIFGLSSNSALLGSNLGPSPGANHDAHHIVMTGTKNPKMNSLVDQMKTHGIDPDGKQNGIWLARTDADKISGVSPNTSHKQDGLHGNAYKDELFDRLDGKNKKDFKKEMAKIKQELKAGRTWDTATPKKLGKTCR
ncbi:DUF6531 domain-containing protein [uncultured Lacinutrix sp.]|uniref:DUF6531 domain-containing protein n=1 Tax=uncultured Lacinutrix sp. TaxID=574032 RepID=UPI002628F1BF|nr:DUF6531 domain-containing protein [uncultured Lacinutrix sp.]